MQSLSHKNGFDLHENEPVGEKKFIRMVLHKTRLDTEEKGN